VLIAITSVTVFAAVTLLVTALRTRQVDPVAARLRAVQAGIRQRNPILEQPFITRAIVPAASGIARFLMRLMPSTWLQETERWLLWAGNPVTLPGFVLIWAAMVIGFGLCPVLITSSSDASPVVVIIAGAIGVAAGVFLPQFWLRMRVSERQYQTRKGLPDAIDLMTTSVEAGLSLDAALVRVAEYQAGPFQDELTRALQDMTLGKSRRDALEEICERLNVPEVLNFVQTVNQAEATGAPIGQVLRVQAEQVRIGRRQAAEAQAQRAPLLMIIPLILFIFPSLFVVLLAPVALTIIDLLTNNQVFR